mmetsp:Transcript_38110/g.92697  ORF Transcript_38110/g.92697 Transcript_38110/m.92697 type:complete len:258 (-) Transcript_38110:259-1032(-)|eukprot:CAMPEP_0113462692 /NCGR_PEP_ID=MMETSP0014_2-20120614/12242_1 /TAXON_ID=2857 /ORGANISM="Nitzschia sp." /LENGTH=257 /DNA_ID=CAMNT_0000354601 /DNA_START=107 /DNA_END=880 /DNA_ORIENTATION=- /assembly_acc=CAM_ASM_000159
MRGLAVVNSSYLLLSTLLFVAAGPGDVVVDAKLSKVTSSSSSNTDGTTTNDEILQNSNNNNNKNVTKLDKFRDMSLCEHIRPDELPTECSCREPGPFDIVIECTKTFNSTNFNDTIGLSINLLPCDPDGSKVSLDVTEKEHGIDFPITGLRAGEANNIPIPGLSIAVPAVGHLGVDAAVLITGNPDSLTLKIGLNACVALAHKMMCASDIPGLNAILPWYVLSGTYSFGDICQNNRTGIVEAKVLEKDETTVKIMRD